MAGFGFWPVAVQPVGNVACGTVLWRTAGRLHVTAVVKATFSLVAEGVVEPAAPVPLVREHGELAPYLGLTDVVVTAAHAFACPPSPVTAVAVRVAVVREWPLLDKRLLVYGADPRVGSSRSLFTQAAVVAPDGPEGALGVLLDPAHPKQPVGYGMLSATDPQRASLLGSASRPELVRGVLEIPDSFCWEYFQVAPVDQRISYLHGDEWLVLDGMHPERPRIKCQLPGAQAAVRVYPPSRAAAEGPTFEVAMQADRLNIDADAMTCSVLWRGSFPVADEISARALTLLCALTTPGQPLLLPQVASPIRSPLRMDPGPGAGRAGLPSMVDDEDSEYDANAKTARIERERAGRTFDAAQARAIARMAEWMADDGATTTVHEPASDPPVRERPARRGGPGDRPRALPTLEEPTCAEGLDLLPPTERLGTRAPTPSMLREPDPRRFEPLPQPPGRPHKTLPYQFPADDSRVGEGEDSLTQPLGAAEDPEDSRTQPLGAGANADLGPPTERYSRPSQPEVARPEQALAPTEAAPPRSIGADVTLALEPSAPRRAAPAAGPIVPSRAELPIYLPSEAKRWARGASSSSPAPALPRPASSPPSPGSQLELTADGAVSVRFLGDSDYDTIDDPETEDDPATAAVPWLSEAQPSPDPTASRPFSLRRSAAAPPGSAPTPASGWDDAKAFGASTHMLRPQPIPGAPWTNESGGSTASNPRSSPSEPPSDRPVLSVHELEGSLSETWSVRDGDFEIVDEDTSVSEDFVPRPDPDEGSSD